MVLKEKLMSLLKNAYSLAKDIEILLIVNVLDESHQDEPSHDPSMRAKFYHPKDIAHLKKVWTSIGYSVKVLKDEEGLVRFFSSGKHKESSKRLLVYNMADRSHGPGRKALVPSLCALYGVDYCNSDAAANSLARHKYHCGLLAQCCDVLVPKTWYFDHHGWVNNSPPIEETIILKPTYECQGKGIDDQSVLNYKGKDDVIEKRYQKLCQPLTVQSFIEGYEISINILEFPDGLIALPPVALRFEGEAYLGTLYRQNKHYFEKGQDFHPYQGEKEIVKKMIKDAETIHRLFGFRAVSRSDFRLTKEGKAYVIDINETPAIFPGGAFLQALLSTELSLEDCYHSLLAINMALKGWIRD